MFIVYNLIYIFVLPLLILKDFFRKDHGGIRLISKRFGLGLSEQKHTHIWLHGVSLGEIKTLIPVANSFLQKNERILLSSTTNTGISKINKLFGENPNVEIIPFPYDFQSIHNKIIKSFRVKKIILFESEFWPNLLSQKNDEVKIVSFNTIISDNTFSRYKFFKSFIKEALSTIDMFFVQSLDAASKLKNFGLSNVKVLGNIKIYKETYEANQSDYQRIKNKISDCSKCIFTAGSTHNNEEEFIISSLPENNELLLFIAPRHPERFISVERLLEKQKFKWSKFSEIEKVTDEKIILFDEVGTLFELYMNSNFAVVGGSIKYKKGHNFLEPIFAGTSVITGANLENYLEIKSLFCDTGVIETFTSESELRGLVNLYIDQKVRERRLIVQKTEIDKFGGKYKQIIQELHEI
ncbi:MAG: hypothetical protein CMD89_03285 [Gammaproteobacteria bacterium]|nr:hypothetical protein [Gammaproteobacteria bacterium]|tara:strand:- start:70782 stop:72008 length:1227 start_codon:yes stop_codon:yes gene_type:complete